MRTGLRVRQAQSLHFIRLFSAPYIIHTRFIILGEWKEGNGGKKNENEEAALREERDSLWTTLAEYETTGPRRRGRARGKGPHGRTGSVYRAEASRGLGDGFFAAARALPLFGTETEEFG